MIEEAGEDDGERRGAPDAKRVDTVVGLIKHQGPSWQEGDVVDLPSGAWRPQLVSTDGSAVLHVHLATRVRPYLATRLMQATKSGKLVHVALELEALYQEETVRLLNSLDAEVHIIEGETVREAQHFLTALTDQSVPVSPAVRTTLGDTGWERRTLGNTYERGRRFEGLLGFLLSQVADFKVKERNLRGETDELDIVVQIDNYSRRCWQKSGAPFVLVEAKNWTKPVDQKEVSAFMTKLQTKRGTARFGCLVGASGFTSAAQTQILKFATQEHIMVLLEPEELQKWIASETSDDFLEDLVRRAMLT